MSMMDWEGEIKVLGKRVYVNARMSVDGDDIEVSHYVATDDDGVEVKELGTYFEERIIDLVRNDLDNPEPPEIPEGQLNA